MLINQPKIDINKFEIFIHPKSYIHSIIKFINSHKKSHLKIPETAFSTITINRNFRTALHRDAGDYKDGFGNLTVINALLLFNKFSLLKIISSPLIFKDNIIFSSKLIPGNDTGTDPVAITIFLHSISLSSPSLDFIVNLLGDIIFASP